MNEIIKSVKKNKWLVLILILATFLRFYKIEFQSLWMDEIYTMNISNPKFTLAEFHSEMLLREGFPYLYYVLLKLSYFFFGYSPFVARGFSAIFGVIGVYAIYKIVRLLSNKETALITALLLAINEYHIFISQDARLYTLYFVATIFSFYRLILFIKNKNIRNTIWYGISAGILISVNFFGFVNLLSHVFIILFFIALTEKAERKDFLLKSIFSGIISIILFLPNYDMLIKLLNYKSFWVAAPTDESFTLLFKEFLGNSEMTLFIFSPIYVYYLVTLFSKKTKTSLKELNDNKSNFGFIIYFGWIFIFIYFLMIRSYGEVSLILTRYFTSIQPVLLIVVATGIGFIRNNLIKRITILTIIIFSLSNLIVVKDYYNRVSKAQFKESSEFVITKHKNGESIYTSQKYWFDYYFINDSIERNIQEIEFEDLIQSMIQDSTKIKSFWFVDAFGKTYNPSEQAKGFIEKEYMVENSFDGFQAWAKHFVLKSEISQTIDLRELDITKQYNGEVFMNNIEVFEINNGFLTISGWAYFNKISSENTSIDLVLINEKTDVKKVKKLLIQSRNRPDVTRYFNCDFNADNSGFYAKIDLNKLDNEEYNLGIYLENKELQKKALFITEKKIKKIN